MFMNAADIQERSTSNMTIKGIRQMYLLQAKMLFLGSSLFQTSPTLDNTLWMKVDLVNTFPITACFGTADNGLGRETVK